MCNFAESGILKFISAIKYRNVCLSEQNKKLSFVKRIWTLKNLFDECPTSQTCHSRNLQHEELASPSPDTVD